MPDTTWLVLADSSRATIYKTDPALTEGPLLIHELDHPRARLSSGEIASDDRGRRKGGAGVGRKTPSGTSPQTDPHEHEASVFSKELADWIGTARKRNAYDGMVLVAPPQFLGLLRRDLDSVTRDLIDVEVDKGLTHLAAHEVLAEVKKRIPDHRA